MKMLHCSLIFEKQSTKWTKNTPKISKAETGPTQSLANRPPQPYLDIHIKYRKTYTYTNKDKQRLLYSSSE